MLQKQSSSWGVYVGGKLVGQVAGKELAERMFQAVCAALKVAGVEYSTVKINPKAKP